MQVDKVRSVLFAAFVASGFIPMIHACMLDGTAALGLFPLAHAIGMEAFYLTGVIFYITRYPEKHHPETFDIWVGTASECLGRYTLLIGAGIKPSNISCFGRHGPAGIHYWAETDGPTRRACVVSDCIEVGFWAWALRLQRDDECLPRRITVGTENIRGLPVTRRSTEYIDYGK